MRKGKLTVDYQEALADDLIHSFLKFANENEDVLDFFLKHHKDIFPSPPEILFLKQIPFFPIISWSNNLDEIIEREKIENESEEDDNEDTDEEENEITQIIQKSMEEKIIDIRAIALYSIITAIKQDERLKNLIVNDNYNNFKEFRNELGSVVKDPMMEKLEESIKDFDFQTKDLHQDLDDKTVESYLENNFINIINSVLKEISRNLSPILYVVGILGIFPTLLNILTHKWYVQSVTTGNYNDDILNVIMKLEKRDFISPNITSIFCIECLNHRNKIRDEEKEEEMEESDSSFFYANVPPNIPLDYDPGNCPYCGRHLTRNTIWTLKPEFVDLFIANDGFISYYVAYLLEKEGITWEASVPTNRETDFLISIQHDEMIIECKKYQRSEEKKYSAKVIDAEKQLKDNMNYLDISKGIIIVNLKDFLQFSDNMVYAGDIDLIRNLFE